MGYSIQSFLGGQPLHPWPSVPKAVPHTAPGKPPFIQPGHIFVAGTNGWNPYMPYYAGDDGLVMKEAIEERLLEIAEDEKRAKLKAERDAEKARLEAERLKREAKLAKVKAQRKQ